MSNIKITATVTAEVTITEDRMKQILLEGGADVTGDMDEDLDMLEQVINEQWGLQTLADAGFSTESLDVSAKEV